MAKNVEEKLQELLQNYSKNLPGKVTALRGAWYELTQNWDKKNLEKLHREVHSLVGSAATYGYHNLSQSAHQLEIYLSILEARPLEVSAEQIAEGELLFKNLIIDRKVNLSLTLSANTKVRPKHNIIYFLEADEKYFYELLARLSESNFTIIRHKNFDELRSALKQVLPMVMLIDVEHMPDSILESICSLAKQLEVAVPIICISKEDNLQIRLKALRAGSVGFLQKPVDTFQLTKKLDEFVESETRDPYRILIVDDSETLSAYHSLILEEAGMHTAIVNKPLEMLMRVADFQPDLILMDVYMPDCSGLELAAILRQQPLYMGIPIIFLSSEADRLKQLSALHIGGDDFLTKPILPQHLIATVRSRAKRAGILSFFMIRDSLTELLNHTTMLQQLRVELSRTKHIGQPLSFVILDIDNFKAINDTYGHPIGDYVLRKISELLLSQLRRSDIVGRYGGDEFAIILPNTDEKLSRKLCDRICEQFSHLQFKSGSTDFPVTFSAGIATSPPYDTSDNLIAAADKALYQAKAEGRNRVIHIRSMQKN